MIVCALTLSACGDAASGREAAPDARVAQSARALTAAPPVTRAQVSAHAEPSASALRPLRAGESIAIPATTMRAGSAPGSAFRDPTVEADLIPVPLQAFTIDRLPYPNDPSQPPRAAVSRAEAEGLCASAGKRLCHELEWELACEGVEHTTFPGGESFGAARCARDPRACASSFGVVAPGVFGREWTSSSTTVGLGDAMRTAVVRGGSASGDAPLHRCAARHAITPDSRSDTLIFRCCGGAPQRVSYPIERDRPMFREEDMPIARAREIFASVPELKRMSSNFNRFSEDDVERVLTRGRTTREAVPGWTFTHNVLVWSPRYGEEVWLFTGVGQGSAMVAALYPMPDGTFRHAASFILADEPVPVTLTYSRQSQREVLWSACWGCGGEGGAITFRDDGRIVIVQR